MSERDPLITTPSQTVGPFFHFGLSRGSSGQALPDPNGAQHATVCVRVLDGDGAPLDDALVEFWTALGTCGRSATARDGTCEIDTDVPAGGYVNVCLFARGLLRHVFTRIYFSGHVDRDADPVLSLVPEERRPTVFATADGEGRWRFDIHLQGPLETVFFDQ